MSNLGIAGFEKYHKKDEFDSPSWNDLKVYFKETFYHEPTNEQLEIFFYYMIGKEKDVEKVIEFCTQNKSNIENQKQ